MDRLRVSQHNSDAGSWRIASLEPEGPLAPYVGAFYAYDERGARFIAAASCQTALQSWSSISAVSSASSIRGKRSVRLARARDFIAARARPTPSRRRTARRRARRSSSAFWARGDFWAALWRVWRWARRRVAGFRRTGDGTSGSPCRSTIAGREGEDALARSRAEARFGERNRTRARVRFPAPEPRRRPDRGRGPGDRNGPRTLFQDFSPGVRAASEDLRAGPPLRPRTPLPATAAVFDWRRARRTVRIRRPSPHDPRFQEFSGSSPSALWRQELPDAAGFVD